MTQPRNDTIYKIENDNIKNFKVGISQEVHIISPGPSIRNYDWRKLRGLEIMTVNDSLFYLPIKVNYHVYNEPPVEKREIENYKKASNYNKIQKFTTFNITGWHQLNLFPGKNLAFILAINIAIELGYKKAYLYGYDFSCEGGYTHWWDKEKTTDNDINKKIEILDLQKSIFEDFKEIVTEKIELIHITE